MLQELFVGLGGFAGAVSRYGVNALAGRFYAGTLPVGTLLVNIVGSFLIGLITAWAAKTQAMPKELLLFLTVGFMGGFTTFSSFSLDSINLLEQGKIGIAALNISFNVALCIFMCWIGKNCIK